MIPWTPDELSPALWFDFSDDATITTDSGGRIVGISSKVGGITATQTQEGLRPIHYNGSAIFDGAARLDTSDPGIVGSDYTVIACARSSKTSDGSYILGSTLGSASRSFHMGWRTTSVVTIAHYGSDINLTASNIINRRAILTGIRSETGSVLRGFGKQKVDSNSDLLTDWVGPTIGWHQNSQNYFHGEIYEILMFSRRLSPAEFEKIEGYMAGKWDADDSLSADHPYKGQPPMVDVEATVSTVAGVVQIDGTPAQRKVRAFGYGETAHTINGADVTLSRSLGHATSDPQTGEYTIDLLGGYDKEVFVVAFDDYGADFKPDLAVTVGDRVHPTTPNGHVWECTGSGTLPSEEPVWVIDTETAQIYGTASMIARPFYRPMVHGPVTPEVVQQDPAP